MQFLGRESRAVDAVRADPAAGHNDHVTGQSAFFVRRLTRDLHWHGADGAAVNQWLAEIALVKHDGTVDRGNAGLVAAMLHTFAHTFEYTARMQQAGRKFALMERRGKTEHIGVAQQVRADTGAHGVAVDAHDAGQCSAVRVQSGRRVVRLHLHADIDGLGNLSTPALSLNTDRQ